MLVKSFTPRESSSKTRSIKWRSWMVCRRNWRAVSPESGRDYPRFRAKRLLRFLFDRFQSDALFNLFLRTRLIRTAAGIVYFHHKGVFDPGTQDEDSRALHPRNRVDPIKRG